MSWSYSCPSCKAGLNPGTTIILVGTYQNTSALVGLHPQPGNYEVFLPPEVKLPPNTLWRFSCPVCRTNLATEISAGLCALDCLYEGTQRRVYFSPVAGEQATVVVRENGRLELHGRDIGKHSFDLLGEI